MFNGVRDTLEAPVKRWLNYCHGVPVDPKRQVQFYRCDGCHGLVTWHRIANGGCDCGVGSRVRAANLRWHEKVRVLVLPWTL